MQFFHTLFKHLVTLKIKDQKYNFAKTVRDFRQYLYNEKNRFRGVCLYTMKIRIRIQVT